MFDLRDYKTTPIFINSRDLLTPLKRLINWLRHAGYYNIYVIDNASTYPPLLEYLDQLSAIVKVIPLGANLGHTAIWTADLIARLNIRTPYVYTDPDIVPIDDCPHNVLEYFHSILTAFPDRPKVGFGLVIDDLPDHFRFKRKVVEWESLFWKKPITTKLYDAPVDTTFALCRPDSSYTSLEGLRSGYPYVARHYPWYENSHRPSAEHTYYVSHAQPGINTWSGDSLPEWLKRAIVNRAASN